MHGVVEIQALPPDEVRRALSAGTSVLIDVREPNEYSAERIDGALLFPLSTFDPAALPDTAGRPIILHCGSGKRSAAALERCQRAGFAVTRHLGGGIAAWKASGLPVVRAGGDPPKRSV